MNGRPYGKKQSKQVTVRQKFWKFAITNSDETKSMLIAYLRILS